MNSNLASGLKINAILALTSKTPTGTSGLHFKKTCISVNLYTRDHNRIACSKTYPCLLRNGHNRGDNARDISPK